MKNTLTYTEHINILARALDIQKYEYKLNEAMLKRKVLISAIETLKDYIDKELFYELKRVFDYEVIRARQGLEWLQNNEGKTEMDYANYLKKNGK